VIFCTTAADNALIAGGGANRGAYTLPGGMMLVIVREQALTGTDTVRR
jgi:hypothetical protein